MGYRSTVQFSSSIEQVFKEMQGVEKRRRSRAASHIRSKIRKKAKAMKKTGNLAKGTYALNKQDYSFIGIRAPGHQAYLLEFGHRARDGSTVAAHPIVYPTFAEEAAAVEKIMSEEWL